MLLALHKAAAIWKENSGLSNLRLVKILVRDQAVYFLAWAHCSQAPPLSWTNLFLRVIFVSILKIVTNFVVDVNLVVASILDFAGNPAFLSILGAHLLFNMKEAGERGLNQGTSCGSELTVSDIDFTATLPATTSEPQDEVAESRMIELEEIC